MQIHIVRHGQTEFNIREPRFRDQLDITLSEVGTQQAETIAIALKAIPFDVIYYSHLRPARRTAVYFSIIRRATEFSSIKSS